MVFEGRCLAGDRTRAVHRLQAVRQKRDAARHGAVLRLPRGGARQAHQERADPGRRRRQHRDPRQDQRRQGAAHHRHLPRSRPGRRPDQQQRQVRRQAARGAVVPAEHAGVVGPDAAADRRLDLLHAPDAGRRQGRRVQLRQEQGAHARRGQQHHHLRRRRRLRRGQGRGQGTGRLPEGPAEVPEARRPHSARRAAGRPSGHRQDLAGQGDRRRGQGAVLLDLRLRLRRDVRRRRRGARARHVRAGQEERALHHLRRRDRRGRPPPRRRPRRRQRRARADAEPDAGRDGRLRDQHSASS